METPVRNHLATLCLQYVKTYDPKSFYILADLAEENYQGGVRNLTKASVWRRYLKKKEESTITDVL